MKDMKFSQLLSYYRERSRYSKTELAEKTNVSPSYIMNLESGFKKAPTLLRCLDVAKALSLNEHDTENFLMTAEEERVGTEEFEILKKYLQKPKKVVIQIKDDGTIQTDADPGISIVMKYPDSADVKVIQGLPRTKPNNRGGLLI